MNTDCIPKEILHDVSLSFQAKWLWAYIYSQDDWWELSALTIMKDTKEWRDSIRKALRELEEAWLLERLRVNINWKFEHSYNIYEYRF